MHILETERLILREMTQADFCDLAEMLKDPRVMYAYERDFSDEDVQQWLDNQLARYGKNGFGMWAVVLKESGEMIGQAGITMQPYKDGEVHEIGYLFKKAFWHNGYATEAATACKKYAFQTLGLSKIYSTIRTNNFPSIAVTKRNGMKIADCYIKYYFGKEMPHFLFEAKKKLEDLSLQELWRLFPIRLAAANPILKTYFDEEKKLLTATLPEKAVYRISHIGSTAVKNISAKPIVDILLETTDAFDPETLNSVLCRNGWLCMSKSKDRISLNKGYTEDGYAEKVFHLHLRLKGDNDELYFRDFLNDNPKIAKRYEALKLELSEKFRFDRDAYTQAKTDFVTDVTRKAKNLYGKKYD